MTYLGVEYAIRIGVGRGEWVIAISFPDTPDNNPILLKIRGGTREQLQSQRVEASVVG